MATGRLEIPANYPNTVAQGIQYMSAVSGISLPIWAMVCASLPKSICNGVGEARCDALGIAAGWLDGRRLEAQHRRKRCSGSIRV